MSVLRDAMKKSDRIAAMLPPSRSGERFHPAYLGYFEHFNRMLYYEAHDVLEHLWLQQRGAADDHFYKGLIQFAGAFVHFKQQYLHPAHAKHGRRLRPGSRLLLLSRHYLAPYGPEHGGLDLLALRRFCESTAEGIVASGYRLNPWNPADPPVLRLEA